MPSKKTPTKATPQNVKTSKPTDKRPAVKPSKLQAEVVPTPISVNGIRDEEAAAAMAPGAKKLVKMAKKKSTKVVHPKAKMTFRHNVLPPLLGIWMFLGILGLLNGQWLVAQYQYRFVKTNPATNFSTQPTTTDPNAPTQLYIPKINLTAPVVTDVKTYDAASVQLGLRRGPVQYGNTANPGQKGNIVIVGHSSGQLWAPGSYKFVFTLLDKLAKEDRIFIDYKGVRYIYRVDATKVVPPTDLSVLDMTDGPELTLITCTPVGTSKNRLVVTAHQISPRPETATALTAEQSGSATTAAIPN